MTNIVILLKRILKYGICIVRFKNNKKAFDINYKKISYNAACQSELVNKENLKEWMNKWGVFGVRPSIRGYRAFSRLFKEEDLINYVPEAISRCFIEPVLTPENFIPFYNDKNSFDLLLPEGFLPKTFLRSIDGKLMDSKYGVVFLQEEENELSSFLSRVTLSDEVVVKPSRSTWGKGFAIFKWIDGVWMNSDGNTLSLTYLKQHYGKNWMIQERLFQSTFMSQFNPTSVNTIRIACYRSVRTGKLVTLNAVLRIGSKGAVVDNASAGGVFVEIKDDGTLGKKVSNKYGKESTTHNGINFSTNEFKIPHYEKIKEFVIDIASRMPHMNLFANDVMIDKNGNPRLVEVNTEGFTYWLYQLNSNPAFGKYTDEIIDFCKKEYKNIDPRITLQLSKD